MPKRHQITIINEWLNIMEGKKVYTTQRYVNSKYIQGKNVRITVTFVLYWIVTGLKSF